jgi:hypothetical protein
MDAATVAIFPFILLMRQLFFSTRSIEKKQSNYEQEECPLNNLKFFLD